MRKKNIVEHQFNSLSIGLKAYKCAIFKMKMVVIYINLWYLKCANNNNNNININNDEMGFDMFLIDSMNIAHKVGGEQRKKNR